MTVPHEGLRDQPMLTEIQKLGSRLWQQAQRSKIKVVLVTSALRGEGKSTTVSYLASALAREQGRRVLAVDADLRGPSLNHHFRAQVDKGIGGVLCGDYSVSDAIVHSGLLEGTSTLDLLLPAEGDDPQWLLNTPRLLEMFDSLRKSYDLVLVDSPAMVPVADAATLIPHCDAVVLAVMAGVSTKHHLKRARELCLGLGANILGLVVGNVQEAAPEYMDMNYYSYANTRPQPMRSAARDKSSPR